MPCRTPPQSPSRLSNKETDNDAYLNLPRRRFWRAHACCPEPCLGATGSRRPKHSPLSIDLAVTYTPERAELAPGNCGCFGCKGPAWTRRYFLERLGHRRQLQQRPRFEHCPQRESEETSIHSRPALQLYRLDRPRRSGQSQSATLRPGSVRRRSCLRWHLPCSERMANSAGSFALEAGGGLNLLLSKSFGVRLLEANYVRTSLPNNFSNSQNDMRLAFGMTWHIGH